jgi:tight adherence protein B
MSSELMPLLIGLGAGLVAVLLGVAVFGGRRRRVVELPGLPGAGTELPSLRRDDSDSGIVTLDRLVKRYLPRRAALRDRLARTGLNISAGSFVMICGTLFLVVFMAQSRIFHMPAFLSFLSAITIGFGVPHSVVGWLGARRLDKFNRLFPDGLDIMVRGLRAGMPLQDSITVVAKEIGNPVGSEFKLIEQSATIGQPLDLALAESAKRIKTTEYQFFVVSLALQRETGGNLGETLSNLSDILRRRQQMKLKIKAMSSEARASAVIIGLLPFAMFTVLMMVNRDYVMKLFIDGRGLIMTGVALFSIVVGIVAMMRMMRFEI